MRSSVAVVFCGVVALLLLLVVPFACSSPSSLLAVARPVPVSATNATTLSVVVGSSFSFHVSFSNADATAAGYGPMIDLVLPALGADGNASSPLVASDGISIPAGGLGANVLDLAVSSSSARTFPISGCLEHPFLRDADNRAQLVCGTPGDVHLALLLPFGAVPPAFPTLTVALTLQLSPLADVGQQHSILFRAGFIYGADPLNNPCCDAPVLEFASNASRSWRTAVVTAVLSSIDARSSAMPPTGRSFAGAVLATLSLPTGIGALHNASLALAAPSQLVYVGGASANRAGALVTLPPIGVPLPPGANVLVAQWLNASSAALTLTMPSFVALRDAAGRNVLDPRTGDPRTLNFTLTASLAWQPNDTRDALAIINSNNSNSNSFSATAASLHLRRSLAATQPLVRASVLTHTITVWISDYFRFANMTVTELLSDGHRFDDSYAPVLRYRLGGNGNASTTNSSSATVVVSTTMPASTYTLTYDFDPLPAGATPPAPMCPCSGRTSLVFDVSALLQSRYALDSIAGACAESLAAPAGWSCNASAESSFVQISYRSIVQQSFNATTLAPRPLATRLIDMGDQVSASATVRANVVFAVAATNSSAASWQMANVQQQSSDVSTATLSVGTLDHSVFALGFNTSAPELLSEQIHAALPVTYRITYSMPAVAHERLLLSHVLPLPLFFATDLASLADAATLSNASTALRMAPAASSGAGTVAIPNVGYWTLGPRDTWHALTQRRASVSVNAVSNAISWDFGASLASDANQPAVIDLLFTLSVSTKPFTDGLYHTALAGSVLQTTNMPTIYRWDSVRLQLRTPLLKASKAIVAVVPVPQADDALGARFIGADIAYTVDSSLASLPVSLATLGLATGSELYSSASGLQANNLCTFALVIQNTGGFGAFDIVVADKAPASLVEPRSIAAASIISDAARPYYHNYDANDDYEDLSDDSHSSRRRHLREIDSNGDIDDDDNHHQINAWLAKAARGMALSVVRGDGKRLDYIPRGPTNTSADLFANGLELIDPTPDSAALPATDGSATQAVGANVVFVLYTLQMAGSTTRWPIPSSVHVNQAGVLQYASANLVGQRDNYVSNGLSGGVAGVATLTIATPSILCSIDSTSEAFTSETPLLAGATPVAIGESAVVRKIITLPAGFSPAVQLVEALDTGIVFVSLNSLTYDSALTTSLSAGWPQTFTSTTSTRLTLTLGNVTNTASTAANITLVYTVSIKASSSQANAQLNARSSWSWATASNVGAASATASCTSVFVLYRPLLAVTKAANTTTVDADDTLRYTITVRHAATSFTDAFNVTITDTPHAAGKLIAGSVNITYSGAGSNAQLPAFVMRSGNATGDSSLLFVASSMALVGSGTTTIQYLVRINVTLAAATAIVNTARVTYQSLPPTSSAFARNHWLALPAVTATATITSRAPRLTLALRSSSDAYTGSTKLVSGNADLAVAEVAVFQLTAEFPEGTSFATVQITLPSGFGHIASGVESIGARLQPSVSSPTLRLLSSDKVLEWDFVAAINTPDNVVSALDRIIFNVTLVVENQPTVTVHGAIQSLVAQVTQYSSSRTTFNVDIVEPLMQWTLTPDRTLVDATSSVRFTLRGTCLAAGTTAYNASVVRLLVPDTLLLNASSLQTAAAGTRSGWTFIVPRSMSLSSAGVLAADWPLLRSGDAVELYFTGKLTQAALLGSVLSVSATAQWASQPVPLPNNNTVSGVIAARHVRWYSAAMSTQLTVPPASLTKLIHATSLVDTDTIGVYLTSAASTITTMPAVAIGESVTYRITVTLPACTAAPLVVHDQLPLLNSVMSVVSASIVGSTGTFEPPITPGKAGVFFDRNGDTFNDQVDWTLGSSSRALLVLTSNATITFELTAIVIDSDRNTAANLAVVAPAQQQQLSDWFLTNQVSVALSASASASALLVEPLVRVDYDVISTINANALLAVGSSVQYRLTIAHASNSSSTAHSLVVDIVSPSIARFVSLGAQSGTCQGVAIDIERLTTMTRLRLPSLPLRTTTGTSDGRMRSSGYPQPLEAQSSCTIVLSMRIIRALVPSRNPSATVSSAFVSYDSMPNYIEHQTRRRTAYDACAFVGSVNGTVPCGAHQSWNATLSRCVCDTGFVGDALLCGVERAVRVMLNQTGTTEAQIDPELQESALSVSVVSVSDKNNLRLYQSSSGGIGSDARIGAPLNTHNTSAPWSVSNVNGLFFIWLPFGVKPDRYTVQLSYTTLPTVSGSTTTIVTVLIDTYYPCPDLDDLSVTEFGFTKAPNLGRAFLEWSQETFTLDVRIEAAYERDQAVVLVDTVDFDSYHGDLRVRANNSCSARPAFPSSIALRTLFQSAPTATSNEALDGTYFAYPDTSSTGWSVSAKDCATVYYERSFTLSELTQCNGIETTTTTDPRTGQTTLAYTGQFFVHTLQPGDEFTYRDAAGFAKFMQIFPFELRFNANFDAVVQAIPSDRIHVVVREMRIEQQADLYMVLETQVYGTGLVNPAAPTLASDTARTLQPDATEEEEEEASSAPCLGNQPGDLCVQRWTYRRAEWNEVGDTGVYQFRWSLQSNTDDELEVPILIRMRVNALQVRVGRLGDLQLSLFNRQAAARAGDTSQQKPFSYLWDANDRMFLRGEVMLNAADVPQYRVELVHLLVCYRPTDDYEITLDKGGCNDPMIRPEHRFSLVSSMAVEPSTDFRTGLFPVDNGRSSVAFGAAWQAFPLTEQSRVYTIHARALLLPPTGSTTNRNRRAVQVLYEPDDRNPGAAGRFLTARATQADTQAGDAGDSPYKTPLLSTVGIGLLTVCCIVGLLLLRSRNGTATRQTSGAA